VLAGTGVKSKLRKSKPETKRPKPNAKKPSVKPNAPLMNSTKTIPLKKLEISARISTSGYYHP
jgi:hypothetical protein